MFQKHSIMGRLAIGKTSGFIIGAIAFFMFPIAGVDAPIELRLGMWLMMILMGATIGLIGILDEVPVLEFKMKWWMRGAVAGGSFFLMFILLSFDQMQTVMVDFTSMAWTGLSSPYWKILDGVAIGLIISFLATKISGEGQLTLK